MRDRSRSDQFLICQTGGTLARYTTVKGEVPFTRSGFQPDKTFARMIAAHQVDDSTRRPGFTHKDNSIPGKSVRGRQRVAQPPPTEETGGELRTGPHAILSKQLYEYWNQSCRRNSSLLSNAI